MIYKYNKKELLFKNVFLKYVSTTFLTVMLLIIVTAFIAFSYGKEEGVTSLSNEERSIIIKKIDPFKVNELKDYLNELNVKFPDVVYAQARLETNGFKSKIFRENNNLFGMKAATRRSSTNKGEQHGHAYYDSWRESVIDFALWQCRYLNNISTREQYFEYLRANYAEDPNYINKLEKILNER
jgi:uncharacterized FlgJ-related protein